MIGNQQGPTGGGGNGAQFKQKAVRGGGQQGAGYHPYQRWYVVNNSIWTCHEIHIYILILLFWCRSSHDLMKLWKTSITRLRIRLCNGLTRSHNRSVLGLCACVHQTASQNKDHGIKNSIGVAVCKDNYFCCRAFLLTTKFDVVWIYYSINVFFYSTSVCFLYYISIFRYTIPRIYNITTGGGKNLYLNWQSALCRIGLMWCNVQCISLMLNSSVPG